MKQLLAFVLISITIFSSCGDTSDPEVSDVNILVEIRHFDHSFFAMDSTHFDEDLSQLKRDFPAFFAMGQDDEVLKRRFYDLQIRELYTSVDSIYKSTEVLDADLSTAFQYFYHYFPTHDSLKLYTWVSNFENIEPVIVSENTLLVALDMYLGSESNFYTTAPDYIKQRFDMRYIPSDVFHSYFIENIPLLNDNSLLASMIHYGKIHYLCSKMLPAEEQEIIMSYPKNKMNWCLSNESNIWSYFIENQLLFSTQYQTKQRFIEDAPFSKFYTSFDTDSPGRVGQWIGWRIVNSYMDSHPEISLTDLIKEQDAQKILRESRYKPKQ
jgi:hypothetical protein